MEAATPPSTYGETEEGTLDSELRVEPGVLRDNWEWPTFEGSFGHFAPQPGANSGDISRGAMCPSDGS